jgi:hypothetical protein
MLKDIVAVKPLTGYQLWLTFEDGIEGVVDISQLMEFSGIFAPLQEVETFAQVQIHPELGTLIWQMALTSTLMCCTPLSLGNPFPVIPRPPLSKARSPQKTGR